MTIILNFNLALSEVVDIGTNEFLDPENVSLDTKIMIIGGLEANISYIMNFYGGHFDIQDGGYIEWINCWVPSFIYIYESSYNYLTPVSIFMFLSNFARLVYIIDLNSCTTDR